jgi:hypothetical protein
VEIPHLLLCGKQFYPSAAPNQVQKSNFVLTIVSQMSQIDTLLLMPVYFRRDESKFFRTHRPDDIGPAPMTMLTPRWR